MKSYEILGVTVYSPSIKALLFNKTMFLAYFLLAIGMYGAYEVIIERYFPFMDVHAQSAAEHLKFLVFEHTSEVHRQEPWTLYITNYMYMIYSGSGIVFIVALAELFGIKVIQQTAAGFMSIGLMMVFGGLFTIAMDLNILHMQYMFTNPNMTSGMWLMLPLYTVYIPFVILEIYLLLTKHQKQVKKVAVFILLLSILIDVVEYYIQAKLFDMNTARHLWTTYPFLPLYFIISSFVASIAVMILFSMLIYKQRLGNKFQNLLRFLKKIGLVMIVLLATYEAVAFLFIDKDWASVILFGSFKYFFYAYTIFTVAIPFSVLVIRLCNGTTNPRQLTIAALFMLVGTYMGRLLFVYGGNAYPMSNRFGTGFEKYSEYSQVQSHIFFTPSFAEISVVIGSIGVVIGLYKIFDTFLDISKLREH